MANYYKLQVSYIRGDMFRAGKVFVIFLVASLLLQPSYVTFEEDPIGDGGCTTLVAAGNATRDGSVILAKNRDLSEYEIQWLYRAPREEHPEGSKVGLQYIEIPQAPVTWAWVGSKSHTKKWGVGMGINEWGVSVGDNDAPTREPLEGESGLHDNDICRLILERSRTAEEGMWVAGALIEEYGHSFIGEIYCIADQEEAWIVECAGHHWAAVKIVDGVTVRANQFQITDRWDAGSDDLVEYAVEKGWCSSAAAFNFAECYSKPGYPYQSSQTRYERGTDVLGEKAGDLTREDLINALSDHYEGTSMHRTAHNNDFYRTICSRRTVSAMVAHLKPDQPSEMQAMWYCMSSPCISVFTPVYANVSEVPDPYLTGEAPEDISNYDEDSAWWVFKKIQLLVDEDYEDLNPTVRAVWDDLYGQGVEKFEELEVELLGLFAEGEREEARRMMDSFVTERLMEAYDRALNMVQELSGGEEEEPAAVQEDEGYDKTLTTVGVIAISIIILGGLALYIRKTT